MFDKKLCILIADDEIKIVKALKDFFKANGFHVLEAVDGGEALDVFYENNTKIDIILLDVMMPVADGFSVLREIRETSLVPVIMLTAKGEEYDQIKGFQNGADDYIPKPFSITLLLARVEAVLKRAGKSKNDEVSAGNMRINVLRRTIYVNDERLDLTPKEFDLMHYLVLNRNMALSREQILNSVWGYDFEGDIRTVDTHVKQLRNKLGVHAACIKTVHKIGYQFELQGTGL
ncbi:MAG: response regulator transcription factor [Clostridiales Family XIII bacterium]|jgi:DNA-binding response OmpR family regulator|nr:response regulator transcription factor [Clostridiales Family XIII bacterium]